MDDCKVPDVVQNLQNLIDGQETRLEEATKQTSDIQDQVKTLRSQLSSLKNAMYNAQQSLKEMNEKRNSMCDAHYMKNKANRPWQGKLRLDKALDNYINENDFEEALDSVTTTAIKEEQEEIKEDQSFSCTEKGCTSAYKTKKSLKRHISDKHREIKGDDENVDEHDEENKIDFKTGISQLAAQIKTGDFEHEINDDNEYSAAEEYSNDTFTGTQKRQRGSNSSRGSRKENPCDECSYVGPQDKLKRHKDTVHSDLRPFTCDYCEFAAKRKDKLKLHLQKKHF